MKGIVVLEKELRISAAILCVLTDAELETLRNIAKAASERLAGGAE